MNNCFLILPVLLLLINCSAKNEEQNITKHHPEITSRTDTIKVPLRIEGMVESMRMYLVKSPEGFPIQFSTYVPVEMATDTASRKDGKRINIVANFGGRLNKDARLTIFAFAESLGTKTIHKKVTEIAQKYNALPGDSSLHPWAKKTYDLGRETFGFLALGRKNNVWFYVLTTYPPRYADGMVPRVNLILEKWRWTDGKLLIRTAKK